MQHWRKLTLCHSESSLLGAGETPGGTRGWPATSSLSLPCQAPDPGSSQESLGCTAASLYIAGSQWG